MVQSSWFDFSHNLPAYSSINLSSTTIVRPARIEDISQIGEILTLSFNEFNDFTWWIYPLLKLGVCQDLRGRLQNKDQDFESFCLVAVMINKMGREIYQKIVGTVELSFRNHSHWCNHQKYSYIANLAVSENCRRQGIASKLLSKCEQIAQQRNFEQISLHVLAGNKIGQELYLKNGYEIKQVETDLYSLFVTNKRRLLLTKSLK
jgi:ribosomal protein S18 acetylase RimI-like enzyme